MKNGRTPVDLGFAEFAAQVVAELHEAVLASQDEQDARRTKLADVAAIPVDQFARRFIGDDLINAELARLFPVRRGASHPIRAGVTYKPAAGKRPEMPPLHGKLGIRMSSRDLVVRGKRATLTPAGVRSIREAVRTRLADARLKALRQAAAQGMPRVVVDSGRVNVKLSFRLVDLAKAGTRGAQNGHVVPLASLTAGAGANKILARYRLVVRQINDQTMPVTPEEATGIGELDLTFKTI